MSAWEGVGLRRGLWTQNEGTLYSRKSVQSCWCSDGCHCACWPCSCAMAVVGEAHWSQRRHLMTSREDRHELVSEEGEEEAWGTHAFLRSSDGVLWGVRLPSVHLGVSWGLGMWIGRTGARAPSDLPSLRLLQPKQED